jgi:DNA replication and repair protein RecF
VRVETLSTTQFRNLNHRSLSFAPGVNLITGENGQGKTNLLEAVFFFKFGRSFRTRIDEEMIRFGEAYCRAEVSCVFDDDHGEGFAAALERGGGKNIKINGKPVEKLLGLVGRYPVVLFGPQDMGLVTGQPAERRRFLDMVGSMTDSAYVGVLKEYRRILSQRNAALRAQASRRERDVWNKELVEKGCTLTLHRVALTSVLERHLKQHAAGLNAPFKFALSYDSAVVRETGATDDGHKTDGIDLQAVFETKLLSLETEELRRGTTLVGPHRDDLAITMGGETVRRFGSQGQRRLLAVLLKLAELSHLETELKERCVLLLDDVFSEFDREITARLQGLLGGDRQVLVTSPVPLDWAASHDLTTFEVRAGVVAAAS